MAMAVRCAHGRDEVRARSFFLDGVLSVAAHDPHVRAELLASLGSRMSSGGGGHYAAAPETTGAGAVVGTAGGTVAADGAGAPVATGCAVGEGSDAGGLLAGAGPLAAASIRRAGDGRGLAAEPSSGFPLHEQHGVAGELRLDERIEHLDRFAPARGFGAEAGRGAALDRLRVVPRFVTLSLSAPAASFSCARKSPGSPASVKVAAYLPAAAPIAPAASMS